MVDNTFLLSLTLFPGILFVEVGLKAPFLTYKALLPVEKRLNLISICVRSFLCE